MTFWDIWWRTFAWCAAIAGAVALLCLAVVFMPPLAWKIIWVTIVALGFITYLAFFIWIDKGARK